MSYSCSEFHELYTLCFPPALRMAMSLLHNVDEARDVVHEVMLRLWESGLRVENPPAFVVRSVRNASLNRLESIETRRRIEQRLALDPPPDDFDPDERNAEVLTAMKILLTAREQKVMDKIYIEGLSYKDAAEDLGVSVASINKNIVGALKKLRTRFKTLKK